MFQAKHSVLNYSAGLWNPYIDHDGTAGFTTRVVGAFERHKRMRAFISTDVRRTWHGEPRSTPADVLEAILHTSQPEFELTGA